MAYNNEPTRIHIGNEDYILLVNYQNQDSYRAAFNALTKKVFNLTFEPWYQAGYWKEKYIPYTLFDGAKAIANASVNVIDFKILGKLRRCVQLGTIATDEEYRNKGLSRFLMDHILKKWNGQCDFIYLFANPSVLTFYPKFGFEQVTEYTYMKPTRLSHASNFEKVDMGSHASRARLYQYIQHSTPFSSLSMQGNPDLVMFYCTTVLKENVFYSDTLDTFVIATINEEQLHLWDVFSIKHVHLETVIQSLGNRCKNEILLGFTPQDTQGYEVKEKQDEDVLFIQMNKTDLFKKNKLMFPLLSHA